MLLRPWTQPRVVRQHRHLHPFKAIFYALVGLLVLAVSLQCMRDMIPLGGYPSDTTSVPINSRNRELKQYMLHLVNEAREGAGVNRVKIGRNDAAQLHAEQALKTCASSHWDQFGLKPYMRYTLAGGYHTNGENWASYFSCGEGRIWLTPFGNPSEDALRERIEDAVASLLDSPGHRKTMLDPAYARMSVGIAWNEEIIVLVQHFETDLVRFQQRPSVEAGILSFKGSTRKLPPFGEDKDLVVLITYDPPPEPLHLNRLARTSWWLPGSYL